MLGLEARSCAVRSGNEKLASVASVWGSNMYSFGPEALMQIEITRPARSKVIEPQSCPGAR